MKSLKEASFQHLTRGDLLSCSIEKLYNFLNIKDVSGTNVEILKKQIESSLSNYEKDFIILKFRELNSMLISKEEQYLGLLQG